jgi:hypothetical protein
MNVNMVSTSTLRSLFRDAVRPYRTDRHMERFVSRNDFLHYQAESLEIRYRWLYIR